MHSLSQLSKCTSKYKLIKIITGYDTSGISGPGFGDSAPGYGYLGDVDHHPHYGTGNVHGGYGFSGPGPGHGVYTSGHGGEQTTGISSVSMKYFIALLRHLVRQISARGNEK